jgi:hypothetical protein
MTDVAILDQAFSWILSSVVTSGQAPHYTELGRELGLGPEEAKQVAHDVIAATPGWMHPGTDYIASFPPFNVQPTQYRVSVDGRSGWFAQCGFEATAIRWLFPGITIRIEAPCLCCGDSMVIEMRDEEILLVDPDTVVGYTSAEVGGDAANRPFR